MSLKSHFTRCIWFLFFAFYANIASSQSTSRLDNESAQEFLNRYIGERVSKPVSLMELADSNFTAILYFEILPESKLRYDAPFFNPYEGVATVTLFSAWVSENGEQYTQVTIDTLDANSGCCPCHFPVVVDSAQFLFGESYEELVLYQTHPVRPDCSSMTHYSAQLYADFWTSLKADRQGQNPIARQSYYPGNIESKREMIKNFKRKSIREKH